MNVQSHLKGENFGVQHEYENVKANIKSFNSRNKERNQEKKFDVLEACVTSNDIW